MTLDDDGLLRRILLLVHLKFFDEIFTLFTLTNLKQFYLNQIGSPAIRPIPVAERTNLHGPRARFDDLV